MSRQMRKYSLSSKTTVTPGGPCLCPPQYVGSKDIRWQKSYAVQLHLPIPSMLTEHLHVPGHVLGAGGCLGDSHGPCFREV